MCKPLVYAIENRQLINQVVKEIGNTISDLATQRGRCGLLNGLTGDLLFLHKLNQYDPDYVDETVFDKKLEFVQQQLAASVQNFSLSSGLSGQGWFLEYLNQQQASDYDPQLCEEIDNILLEVLSTDDWLSEIEMVAGLGGIAVYASRRQLKVNTTKLFGKIIRHYENMAVSTSDNTLSWSQPGNSRFRFNKDNRAKSEFNLGLAHGVPGIIAAILRALAIPGLEKRTISLLEKSCNWLIKQEITSEENISCFASSCSSKRGSRLGWCYGDLTIALTLARVGKAIECPSYIEKAKQISLHAASRDSQSGMVNDAGLCHGNAGLALIFLLLSHQLDEPQLLDAANTWLSHTLDLFRNNGLQGFHALSGLTNSYEEDTGFLNGYGGIGLCLLATLNGDVDWVDCLFMA